MYHILWRDSPILFGSTLNLSVQQLHAGLAKRDVKEVEWWARQLLRPAPTPTIPRVLGHFRSNGGMSLGHIAPFATTRCGPNLGVLYHLVLALADVVGLVRLREVSVKGTMSL